ncbi:uncharacterized protein LOC117787710 isoform X1 [Drosophila innubila]|uniref:uncharacterized protein LOC117787710 isoform X1 n=1 Tax=Drosophila innubila TaxID=198719 RepID=UPI00148BA15F|nr:uncharacterized protein LOC117787710 isoform X1 [Drosophila innubila]
MNSLKRYLQRCHRKLGAFFALLGLLTFFLEQNYVGQQRDLLYWKDFLMILEQHPFVFCLLVLVMILTRLLVLTAHQNVNVGIQTIFSELIRKYHQRKFADFIVRRLLWHLEMAMLRMPPAIKADLLEDPLMQQRLQLAKNMSYKAVDVFRRDAAALLLDRLPLNREDTPFFILKEEELELLNAGYSHISLNVTHDVLRQLLYPKSKSFN